ncbi:MAG: hypothetical protein AAF235_06005 [Planctomycetota bacterium]
MTNRTDDHDGSGDPTGSPNRDQTSDRNRDRNRDLSRGQADIQPYESDAEGVAERIDDGVLPSVRLSDEDVACLDALAAAGFDLAAVEPAELRPRCEAIASVLGRLDAPITDFSEREPASSEAAARIMSAIAAFRASVSVSPAEAPRISQHAADAIDAAVMAEYDPMRVPTSLRRDALAAAALLSLVRETSPEEEAWIKVDRTSRTECVLGAVGAQRAAPRDPIPFESTRGGFMGRVRWNDIVAAASIMLIASAAIVPAFNTARGSAMQAACIGNLGAVASGISLYAGDFSDELPVASAGFAGSWMDVGTDPSRSNSANLFTMVKTDHATLEELACPGNAAAPTGEPAPGDADWRRFEEVSFSYQILPGSKRPRHMLPSGSVVLTDRSPVMLRVAVRRPVVPEANSPQHGERGQHVMRIDGSVSWEKSPVMASGDNIWLPRSLERLIHDARTRIGLLEGDEVPDSPEDAFVGP